MGRLTPFPSGSSRLVCWRRRALAEPVKRPRWSVPAPGTTESVLYSMRAWSPCSSGCLALFGSSWYHRRPLMSLGGSHRRSSRGVHGSRDAGSGTSNKAAPASAQRRRSSPLAVRSAISAGPPRGRPPRKSTGVPRPPLMEARRSRTSADQDTPRPPSRAPGSAGWPKLLTSTSPKCTRASSSARRAALESAPVRSAKSTAGCRRTSPSTYSEAHAAGPLPTDSIAVRPEARLPSSPAPWPVRRGRKCGLWERRSAAPPLVRECGSCCLAAPAGANDIVGTRTSPQPIAQRRADAAVTDAVRHLRATARPRLVLLRRPRRPPRRLGMPQAAIINIVGGCTRH
mmetsp:Transcript_1549/g.5047  ORF Transcript_1549/g.5047 Transcript_1549/m.5047 type:complete len:342 (-) Transcript_1549:19-1044(-)